MNCGMSLIKYLLFTFNFIFAIGGLAILAIGVVVHLQVVPATDFGKYASIASVSMIVVGCIIFVVSFFGCWGAIREVHFMMILFAGSLLIILILQVLIAVFAFQYLDKINDNNISGPYRKPFAKYWDSDHERMVIDVTQSTLHCCGVTSSEDFHIINSNGTIPWSCCNKPIGANCHSQDGIYTDGCVKAIVEASHYAGKTIGAVSVALAAIELVGIILSLCLANTIRNDERRGYRV